MPLDGSEPEAFLDVSDLITCGGEQGLLSVAFAPDYDKAGRSTSTTPTPRERRSRRIPGLDDGATAATDSARELVAIDDFAANHNGGLLLFGPDGELYAGTGDGGGSGDPDRTAQDRTSPLGKAAARRPAARRYESPRSAFATRGATRSTETTATCGSGTSARTRSRRSTRRRRPSSVATLNFGWSAFEGTQPFNDDQQATDAIPPVLEYGRDGGCSVTGGYVVRDPSCTSLYGRYVYGDFCEGELRSFTAEPGRPARDDRALGLGVAQLSSFGEDSAGRLYAVSLDGPVYRLAPERLI